MISSTTTSNGPSPKFQQSPTRSQMPILRFASFSLLFDILSVLVRTVKLNSHLEFQATLIHNLNNGLHLELQVWCGQVSLKVLTSTRLPVAYTAGGAYTSYSLVSL